MTNKDAIDNLQSKLDGSVDTSYEWAETVRIAINALEEQQWIPCKEKLPDDRSYILTTIQVPGRQPHVRSGWYQGRYFMNDNGDTWYCSDMEVKAWRLSPEPYMEDE